MLYFFFPEDIISPQAPKVIALAAWMLTWWITEAAPLPVTAFLPMIGFPFMGVMKISESTAPYADPIIFLFMGGFMLALALEKHKLHERIALKLIRLTGTSGNGIIFGFMMATAFISMWISNSATAMMMLPIGISVVHLTLNNASLPGNISNKGQRNFATGLMLCIGYASSLGGLATIIGTPPNVIFVAMLNDFFGIKVSFVQWLIIGFPVAMLLVLVTYFMVTRIILPNGLKKIEGSAELFEKRLKDLGPMRKEEKLVLIIFSITASLWIFSSLINDLFNFDLLNDTSIAVMGGLAMFLMPVDFGKGKFVLHWSDTEKLAWGILFLFGGGLCLAKGLDKSGIVQAVGQWIAGQNEYTIWLTLLLIVISLVLTELMSNTAVVNVFVPVAFGIASVMEVNPILLGLPITLAAGVSVMMPMATPPNAIVFSSGYIRIQDMIKVGAWLNLVSLIIIWIFSITVVEWLFG
ncbi:MAG: DASS family sodium-coupled anion symporter [Cyclobacteriaceae bacterium]|nr:DASS family sodium-coupled anion symporter [Cyclobacteriaceae bacterium]